MEDLLFFDEYELFLDEAQSVNVKINRNNRTYFSILTIFAFTAATIDNKFKNTTYFYNLKILIIKV